ncbi:MAG: hypothetical protein KJ574_02735, partial [Nanoarchaeota archaeon]|nr:hypothetical protein [Nanoarchaeota archaeon]
PLPSPRCRFDRTRRHPPFVSKSSGRPAFVQPRNLIPQPRILHDSHIQLAERIDVFWKYLAAAYCKKFRAYNPEKPLMNTIPESIQRKLPRRAKEQIEQNFILEIAKLPR